MAKMLYIHFRLALIRDNLHWEFKLHFFFFASFLFTLVRRVVLFEDPAFFVVACHVMEYIDFCYTNANVYKW